MKFSQNTRVVAPNIINARVQAVTDPMAYGKGGKEWDAFGGALGVGLKVAQKEQDDRDAADVMEARNKIMSDLTKSMYGEDGLFTNGVGENAKGLEDRVTKTVQGTFDYYAKQYNPRVQRALRGNLSENMGNFQRLAGQQEGREFMKQADANDTAALAQGGDMIQKNYMDADTVKLWEDGNQTILAARGRRLGWSGRQIAQAQRGQITADIGQAISLAIQNEDFAAAQDLLDKYGARMEQSKVIPLQNTIKQHKEVADAKNEALYLGNTYGWNKKQMDAQVDAMEKETDTLTIHEPGAGNNKEAFFQAISGQESGGDYNAVNGTSGAFGKYQIMPGNWAAWAKEAGLPDGADMKNPQNQEKVARFKLGQYFDKYGPEGAMVAWYAGEANAERWVKGEPDAVGENGHYSWDAPQAGGAPSVRDYVKQALEKYHPVNVDVSSLPMQDIEDKGLAHTNNALKAKYYSLFDWAKKKYGKELVVSGGWRSDANNRANNGSPTSHHLFGDAIDVDYSMFTPQEQREIMQKARESGFNQSGDAMHDNHGGNGDHLHLTFEDDGSGGTGGGTTKTYQRRKYSDGYIKNLRQYIQSMCADHKRAEQEKEAADFKAFDDHLRSGISATDAQSLYNQYAASHSSADASKAQEALYFRFPELKPKPARTSSGGSGTGRGAGSAGSGSSGGSTTAFDTFRTALEMGKTPTVDQMMKENNWAMNRNNVDEETWNYIHSQEMQGNLADIMDANGGDITATFDSLKARYGADVATLLIGSMNNEYFRE